MELAIIVGIVLLVFAAATATVLFEDRRAQRREALRRKARLASMGEVDPLAPNRLRVDS